MRQATGDKIEAYIPGYKNLEVWKAADELAIAVYQFTRNYPKEELFGLVSQMRRCAVSVPANIVEGYGRRTDKDKLQFYYIARGSLNELEYYLDISRRLGYLPEAEHARAIELRGNVGKLLHGLMRAIEK